MREVLKIVPVFPIPSRMFWQDIEIWLNAAAIKRGGAYCHAGKNDSENRIFANEILHRINKEQIKKEKKLTAL